MITQIKFIACGEWIICWSLTSSYTCSVTMIMYANTGECWWIPSRQMANNSYESWTMSKQWGLWPLFIHTDFTCINDLKTFWTIIASRLNFKPFFSIKFHHSKSVIIMEYRNEHYVGSWSRDHVSGKPVPLKGLGGLRFACGNSDARDALCLLSISYSVSSLHLGFTQIVSISYCALKTVPSTSLVDGGCRSIREPKTLSSACFTFVHLLPQKTLSLF